MSRRAAGIAGCLLQPGGDALSPGAKGGTMSQGDKGHQPYGKNSKLEAKYLIKHSFTMRAGTCVI